MVQRAFTNINILESPWDLAQVVRGWGGFVGSSRFKSQWTKIYLSKEKKKNPYSGDPMSLGKSLGFLPGRPIRQLGRNSMKVNWTAFIRIRFLPCLFQHESHIMPAFIYDAFDHKYQHYFSHFTQTSYFVALRALKRCPSPSQSKPINQPMLHWRIKVSFSSLMSQRFNEMKNQLLSHCSFKYNGIYPSPDYYTYHLAHSKRPSTTKKISVYQIQI